MNFLKLFLIAFLFFTFNGNAKNIYVNDNSQTGDVFTYSVGLVGNNGLTKSTPKLTLTAALAIAVANDSIYIDAGTYNNEVSLNLTLNGVKIVGAGYAATFIDNLYAGVATNYFLYINANNVTLKDLKVTGYENNGTQTPGHSGQAITIGGGASPITGVLIENVEAILNGQSGGNPAISVLANTTATITGGGSFCNTAGTAYTGGVEAYGKNINLLITDYLLGNNYKVGSFDGGGLRIEGDVTTLVTVKRTLISKNIASQGGGISVINGDLKMYDCVIDANSAGQVSSNIYGGGVYISAGDVLFSRCYFKNNFQASGTLRGGAISARYFNTGAFTTNKIINTTIDSCVFQNNSPGAAGMDIYGASGFSNACNITARDCQFLTGGNFNIFSDATSPATSINVTYFGTLPTSSGSNVTRTLSTNTLYTPPSLVPEYSGNCPNIFIGPCTPTVSILSVSSPTICIGNSSVITPTAIPQSASTYTLTSATETLTTFPFTVSPTVTTTYSLIGTSAAGCISANTATTTIVVNSLPTASISSPSALTCGSASISLSSSGGGTYVWSGPGITSGSTTATPTVNLPGTYNVTVTATNGCTATTSVSVTQNTTAPTAGASNTSTLTCTTTTVQLTGTGGGTYAWSGPGITSGSTTASPTVNLPGTYNVTVTATNGCTATASTAITQNTTAPTAGASNTSTLTCTTTTAQLTGTGGGTYAWSGPGITSGSTTATPTVNLPGTYNLTVTAVNGCTATASTAITQNTTAPTASASNTTTLTCTTTTVQLTGTGGGTYAWSGPGITSGSTTAAPIVNLPGTYNLTVTAANGCTATANTSITQNTTTASVSTATSGVLNCTVTSINASATTTTTPVTYNWSGSGITSAANISTITVNQAGTYNYTVTNSANGCKTTGSVSVTQNTATPVATATGGTLTCSNTSTTLVGGPLSGVTYSWSGSGLSGATNLANATATTTGNYTLTTTGTNGCTNTAVATVTNNLTTPTANAGATQTLVCGVSSVTLTGTGTPVGSTATWLGGVSTPNSFTTSVGAPGTYTLVVTHPTSGCTSTSTVAVSSSTNVPQATVNAITNSITCTNSVVAIGVTLSNTDPVSYTWTGPGILGTNNTATTTATLAGTYSVTITNTVSNCQSVFNVVVPTNTTPVTASVTAGSTITCNTSTMTLAATPTGTNYAYVWSGPGTITNGTTANPTVNQGGNYIVTVTDNVNGCVGNYTVAVQTNTTSPSLTLTPSSLTTTCANPTATLIATSSADPSSTYVWTVPSTGSLNNTTINNPVANGSGVFTVQVINTVSGCISAIATVSMTADANIPTLNATASNTLICSNQTTTLSITGADTYTWSTLETAPTITVNPATTTTYSVTGTNTLTGCSNITNVTVSVTPTPTINVSASNTTICAGNTTTLTLTGATSYTVTNPSQTTTGTLTLSPTAQTTYTITGELQGCASTTETITIDVNTLPTVSASNATTCAGSPVTLTANGADTYTWSTTATTNTTTVSPTANTTYTVTGTNTLTGCTSTQTAVDVTVNQLPTVTASANPNTTCTSGTINLTASTTSTSYTWTTGNGVDNTNQNNQTINFSASTLTPGTYTYTVSVTDANGCVSPQATTTVSVIDVPNANFDLSDLVICQNENGTISINTPQSNVSYDWSINGQTITNTNPLTVPSSITNTSGTYTVSVLASLGTCTNTAANTLTVNALPSIALVNPTTSACENTTAQLDVAAPNANYTYNWTNGSNTATGANLTVNPLTQATQGTYMVTVTDANGCTNRTTGKIDIIICETFVPEFFSPNGDGTNDGFVIKNIENYPNNQLKIFNRWGNLVYQKDGYLNEFVGFANVGDAAGKEKLPAGTYYVILVYGDEKTETYNGYLLLQY